MICDVRYNYVISLQGFGVLSTIKIHDTIKSKYRLGREWLKRNRLSQSHSVLTPILGTSSRLLQENKKPVPFNAESSSPFLPLWQV